MPGNWDGKSRPSNDSYRRNFDEIFAKEKEITDISMRQSIARTRFFSSFFLVCGRSPIGKCIGWHGLTEADYLVKLAEWEKKNK